MPWTRALNVSHPRCHSKILNLGENFLVQEEVIVRFTPTTASQPLIKGFISFPHCVSRAWRSLTVWDCFVNADTVRCAKFFLFFLAACMGQVILVTFSWPIGTLLPSSISKTIRLLFCSSDTCHPVSSQSTYFFPPRCSCSTKEKAWGLLAIVYQPASYLFSLPFFFKQEQNSFGAWEKLLNQETVFMFVFKQCFCCLVEIYLTTVFWVKLSSSGNTFAFLHYAWY